MISFRIDWSDLLDVQGTPKSLLRHSLLKASFLWDSAIFVVQLSHPHTTVVKTIALSIQTFVSKVMSLLFNTQCVLAFLPRSTCLLISWLQAPSAVILEHRKINLVTVSIVSQLFAMREYLVQLSLHQESSVSLRVAFELLLVFSELMCSLSLFS